ncbi:MAG: universal stress protein [Solirubrobacteraceae bacterium]|jgi:nucleotide-binding universal stress UspA family protein
MFEKVLWATDGSDAADHALPYARTLAQQSGGELFVIHVTELLQAGKGGGAFPDHADEPDLVGKIERQVADLSAAGVPTKLEEATLFAGGAAHAIADAARERGADIIVVGTRGRTALSGLLLGSVTQRLLHIAPCPVLAVPPAGAR